MSLVKVVCVSIFIISAAGIRVQQNIDFGMYDKAGASEKLAGPPALVRAGREILVEKGVPYPDDPIASHAMEDSIRVFRFGRESRDRSKGRGRPKRRSRVSFLETDVLLSREATHELKDYVVKAGSIGVVVEDLPSENSSDKLRNVYWLSGDYYGRNSSVSDSSLQIIETPKPNDKKGLDALSAVFLEQNLTSPDQFFNNHSLGTIAEAEEGSENGMYKIFDTAYVAGPSNCNNAFKESTITVKFTSGVSKGKVMEVNANKFQPVLDEVFEGEPSTLDLVFVTDATGSMGEHLNSAKRNLLAFADHMRKRPEFMDVRIGAVFYKDIYPTKIHPEETKYSFRKLISRVTGRVDYKTDMVPSLAEDQAVWAAVNLTQHRFSDLEEFTKKQQPSGGGDIPEALTQAIYEGVLPMSWRTDSTKIMVIIADAPPHGLGGDSMDAWPHGEPNFNHKDGNSRNVFAMGKELASHNISAYSLVVPMEGHARDYYLALSEFTGGASFPLIQAGHAFRAIRAAAKRSALQEQYLKRVDGLERYLGREPTTEEIAEELRGVKVVDVASTDIYEGLDKTNVEMFKRLMGSPQMVARYHLDHLEVREIPFSIPEKYKVRRGFSSSRRGSRGSRGAMDISRARGAGGIRSAMRASSASDFARYKSLRKARRM